MKILTRLLSFGSCAAVAGLLHCATRPAAVSLDELQSTRAAVVQRLDGIYSRLQRQLAGFSAATAADRDFSTTLLVDQEKNAPEITEFAGRYMSAMDFSLLDVADSSWLLLSSGHFPASAGNLIADKAELPPGEPRFLVDNIKGETVLTLQIVKQFSIADLRFHAVGGWIVDSAFLQTLQPQPGAQLLITYGDRMLSTEKIVSVSGIKDHSVLVNNKEFMADSLALPGKAGAATLLILLEKPSSGQKR